MPTIPNTNIPGLVPVTVGDGQNTTVLVSVAGLTGGVYWREAVVTLAPGTTFSRNISSWATMPIAVDPNTTTREDIGIITSAPFTVAASGLICESASLLWEGLTLPFISPAAIGVWEVAKVGASDFRRVTVVAAPSSSPVEIGGAGIAWSTGYVVSVGSDINSSFVTTAGGQFVTTLSWYLQW